MGYFDYPLDTAYLLRKKRGIKKELLAKDCNWIEKKVAVLGGSTTNEVVSQLELVLLNSGIKAEFYQSEYGQYWQDGVLGNEELDAFNPDIIVVYTSWRNITTFPTTLNTPEEATEILDSQYKHFTTLWEALEKKFNCPIIQNNFDRPNYRIMGNRDIWDDRGRSNFIAKLNLKFSEYAMAHENFYINDLDYLAADYGLSSWADSTYWHMYKYACNLDAIPYVAGSIGNIIKSIYGKNKKVFVLDLDNTLWGGIVGDDGVEGIAIGPEVPMGQVYAEFQQYLKDMQQVGAVLAIDSKNEHENAIAGLNHPSGILKPDDFVDIKANWEPKDRNIVEIANELTLGMDSFVFVDDNPAEREIVKAQVPSVSVPDIGKVDDYIRVLDHGGYFETTTLSKEDLAKTAQYHAKAQAAQEQASFADYGEYLDSLQMTAEITSFEPIILQRVAQLTNKSNQFNLTTLRCTEDDIKSMEENDSHICLAGRLIDKFADNGIVTVVAGEIVENSAQDKALDIKLWLMSCRVLKRGMEDLMMNTLVADTKAKGASKIVGHYYPTAKNGMVREFFGDFGFSKVSEDADGNAQWELDIDSYEPKEVHIERK